MPLDLIDRIRSFPLFETAPDAFLYEIGLVLKPQMYAPNDYIMTEGDDAKAMYWIVRGAVAVTSRDGESTYAELKPGSFVGEIGILMDRPRTATVIARTRCLGLQLKKEDLRRILPRFPDVERAIREEALERLAILEKKKQQTLGMQPLYPQGRRGSKRARESSDSSMELRAPTELSNHKRRKSPSPDVMEVPSISALGHGLVNVRTLLKELPLFSNLPPEPLHFLGLNAQPRSFSPFTDIIKQNSSGREVFFIVHGEVEVVVEHPEPRGRRNSSSQHAADEQTEIVARLRSGQYFGEVVSLSLASKRTATVRSVTTVECLVIPEAVLQAFWDNVPPGFKHQMESTARRRLRAASIDDVVMADNTRPLDMTKLGLDDGKLKNFSRPPKVMFNDAEQASPLGSPQDDPTVAEPLDPDPFQSQGLDNVRARSRRGSLAPLSPDEAPSTQLRTSRRSPKHSPNRSPLTSPVPSSGMPSPMIEGLSSTMTVSTSFSFAPRMQQPAPPSSGGNQGVLPDDLLELVFSRLELPELMRLQCVSYHWRHILTQSDKLCTYLNLSRYNRQITDAVLIHKICPFVGARPRTIDMTNCFHITDEGFLALAEHCAVNVRCWYMKSVWEVSANAMLEMANRAKNLVEVDLSNCRKVSDVLLARMVGWVVPAPPVATPRTAVGRSANSRTRPRVKTYTVLVNASTPPVGTIIGCPMLRQIRLSYCKHVTDRTMHHFAVHASKRLASLDLTRCTTITDVGFSYWSQDNIKFTKLTKLVLADCTYLSDQAIIYLTNAAGQCLRHLDLSFCCALSDTATEVISLGCPALESLDMSFCGSAISDASLKSIGRHLTNLRSLSVRGCVRVTGVGIDAVVSGCKKLTHFNISQCKHTLPWIESGGEQVWADKGRQVAFESEVKYLAAKQKQKQNLRAAMTNNKL